MPSCRTRSGLQKRVTIRHRSAITEHPKNSDRSKDQRAKILGRYLKYSHVGVQFVLTVGIPTALGFWADHEWGTLVLFTLLGFAIGFAAGLRSIVGELFPKKEDPRKPGTGEENENAGRNEKSGDA